MSPFFWCLVMFLGLVIVAHILQYFFPRSTQTNPVGKNQLSLWTHDNKYPIVEIDDFLTDAECTSLIGAASKKLEPSRVYTDEADLSDTPYRDSMQAWMRNDTHPVVKKINQVAQEMTGHPADHQEDMQVVKYEKGGFFSPHYDACYGDKDFCKRMNQNGGPRLWTFMVYLNDGYEGGETFFPKLGRTIIPKKGKLVVFQNTDTETEELIDDALHGGEPVREGNKWICNKWVRHRHYQK